MPTDYSVFALHNSTRLVWQNRVYWCLRQHWCLGPQAPQRGDPDNSRPVDRAVRVTIGTANLYGYVIQEADSNGRRNEMWSQYGVCRFTLPKQNRTRERRGIERESENESVTRPSGHLTNPSPDTMQVTTTFEITFAVHDAYEKRILAPKDRIWWLFLTYSSPWPYIGDYRPGFPIRDSIRSQWSTRYLPSDENDALLGIIKLHICRLSLELISTSDLPGHAHIYSWSYQDGHFDLGVRDLGIQHNVYWPRARKMQTVNHQRP